MMPMDPRTAAYNQVKIFRDTSLSDLVVDRLNRCESSVLSMSDCDELAYPLRSTDAISTIIIITTGLAVYEWLSVYGPSVFVDVTFTPRGNSHSLLNGLQLSFTRVATVTGDIKLQLEGNPKMVKEALMLFIQKTHKGFLYKAVTLVDRHTALSAPKELSSTQIKCSEYPYGLVTGYLMTLSSRNLDEVLHFCSVFSKARSTRDNIIINIAKLNSPKKLDSHERPLRALPLGLGRANKIVTSNLVKSDPGLQNEKAEMSWKLLEFTREEVTFLIGKSGSRISALRKKTRATIRVVPLNSLTDDVGWLPKPRNTQLTQYIRLTGPKDQVREAMKVIEAEIYQFRMSKE